MENETESQQPEQPQIDIEALQREVEALRNKNQELLGETKAAKAARNEAERKKQEELERIAREKGDFEQLHKSSEERYKSTLTELEQLRSNVATEKRNNAAMKIATEIADGANAEILAEFIARRLTFTDNAIKVTNDAGELTVSSLADLANEFKNNSRFSALLRGNQSSGGSATGSNSGSAGNTQLTRDEFSKLDAIKRMEFVKKGGTITD